MSLRSKPRSAYWPGEKLVLFFKRGALGAMAFIVMGSLILGVKHLTRLFPVKNILVSGNQNLDADEVKDLAYIRDGEGMFGVSFDQLQTRLSKKAWIKKVFLRKQFPDTIMIHIEEAVPKALLSLGGQMFLIDSGGHVLEEIEDQGTPFLPVVVGIDPGNDRGGMLEAMKLIDALGEKDILTHKESVEIMMKSYGLVMKADGDYVKIGYGVYGEKLGRWRDLEEEIRKQGIALDYVDLRFEDEVIVKPSQKKKGGRVKS